MEYKIKKLTYLLILIFLIYTIFYFTKSYFFKDYLNFETLNNDKKIESFIHSIEDDFQKMQLISQSYNINYSFSKRKLKDLELDFYILTNKAGNTISSLYNIKTKSDYLENYLKEEFLYKNMTGFIKFDGKVFFITKSEIKNSNTTNSSANSFFIGKILDEEYLETISSDLSSFELSFSLYKDSLTKEIPSKFFSGVVSTQINNNSFINILKIKDINKIKSFSIILKNKMYFLEKIKKDINLFLIVVTLILSFILLIIFYKNSNTKIKVKQTTEDLESKLATLSNTNQELTKESLLYESIENVTLMGVSQYDIKRNEMLWSKGYYKLIEKEINNFTPTFDKYISFIHPDDSEYVKSIYNQTILENKTLTCIFRLLLGTNKIKHVKATFAVSKKDKEGNPEIISSIVFDITESIEEEKELQSKKALLFERSKMLAMGEMVGNISNQLKQPLNLILTISSSIKLDKEFGNLDEDEIERSMNEIGHATRLLSTTVDDFSMFFFPNKQSVETTISTILKRSYKLINTQFRVENIKIIDSLDDSTIRTYDNQLLQVILNIFNNIRDELKNEDFLKYVFVKSYVFNDKIALTIKDNAGGIDNSVISKVFDANFTTKNSDKYTGMGLYMSKQIVEKNLKGSISVKNEEYFYAGKSYKGACFTISLPLNI